MLQQRRYFGGGTVDVVICADDRWHMMNHPRNYARHKLHDSLEDGTLPFHNIVALGHALDVHEKLFTSMKRISDLTAYLAQKLYSGLSCLRHPQGSPVVRCYADKDVQYGNAETCGATIAFNVLAAGGTIIPFQHLERLANARDIYIRSGALCNPGGIALYLGLTADDFRDAWKENHRCSHPLEILSSGKAIGVVRVSLGAMSNNRDVKAFLRFMRDKFVSGSTAVARATNEDGKRQGG